MAKTAEDGRRESIRKANLEKVRLAEAPQGKMQEFVDELDRWLDDDEDSGRRQRYDGGFSYGSVRNYLTGERPAPLAFLAALQEAFGYRLEWLLGEGGPERRRDAAVAGALEVNIRASGDEEEVLAFREIVAGLNHVHELPWTAKNAVALYFMDRWRRGEVEADPAQIERLTRGLFSLCFHFDSAPAATAAIYSTLGILYQQLANVEDERRQLRKERGEIEEARAEWSRERARAAAFSEERVGARAERPRSKG